ncbi:hypothetical protein K6U06_09465 [Acidiferrimicrobium sp. IK]|uniref:hypothetical protein n=1 Tax=Acidiferrimicrobium sp. IK TaxID=2871700 RepID=UPI0021CB8611|nr:hypothetical protein [Acidiferrimicrobium sp. IK]MCU4184585.1 hypothetical protein [Acidiferrimicrobium sp. IK]
MTPERDYRSEKMDSLEGRGLARSRWDAFMDNELEDVVTSLDLTDLRKADTPLDELDTDVRDEIAGWAKERSELIGFWVAWHLAGGFRQLEQGGWHRATIFRKVARFRTVFGEHPDEATFPWLRLDYRKAWVAEVSRHLTQPRYTD